MNVEERFDVFGYRFAFASPCPTACRRVGTLYDRFVVSAGPGDGRPTFSLNRERLSGRPMWNVRLDDELLASEPTLGSGLRSAEFEICTRIAAHRDDRLTLHAATLCSARGAVLIGGRSGAGKSTLAVALAARGYQLASDDVTLLHPGAPPQIYPLPRSLRLDGRSRKLLLRIGLKLPIGRQGFLTDADLDARPIQAPLVRVIVVLEPEPQDGRPLLTSVVQAEMVGALISQVAWRDSRELEALQVLAQLTAAAACYRLRRGSIEQMCDVVERSLEAA